MCVFLLFFRITKAIIVPVKKTLIIINNLLLNLEKYGQLIREIARTNQDLIAENQQLKQQLNLVLKSTAGLGTLDC